MVEKIINMAMPDTQLMNLAPTHATKPSLTTWVPGIAMLTIFPLFNLSHKALKIVDMAVPGTQLMNLAPNTCHKTFPHDMGAWHCHVDNLPPIQFKPQSFEDC